MIIDERYTEERYKVENKRMKKELHKRIKREKYLGKE